MTNYRASGRIAMLLAALLVFCTLLVSCSINTNLEVKGSKQDFEAMSLDKLEGYVSIGEYKNMSVSLGSKSKGEAVWSAILENAHVEEYPQEHVYYYMEQLEDQYSYYAEQAGVSYKEILAQLGKSEATILQDAKAMTKKDIVYAIILKREGITLTDSEKQTHKDRYIDKYVKDYGYSEAYVEANMIELIYDSMLYDKTTEFLILNNTFSK